MPTKKQKMVEEVQTDISLIHRNIRNGRYSIIRLQESVTSVHKSSIDHFMASNGSLLFI